MLLTSNKQFKKYYKAINEENKIWIARPNNVSTILNFWIFKKKYKTDEIICKYKTKLERLCTKRWHWLAKKRSLQLWNMILLECIEWRLLDYLQRIFIGIWKDISQGIIKLLNCYKIVIMQKWFIKKII